MPFRFFPFVLLTAGCILWACHLQAQQPAGETAAQRPVDAAVPSAIPVETPQDGSVWGALVYASQDTAEEGQGEKDPEAFPGLAKRLAKAFPYKRFKVIGQHTQVVFREYESWVVPSRDVFLKMDSKGVSADGGLNLHLQFWQGQQVLVKTDTVLRPDSPLFIGGPRWRDGQLIFVLELQKNGAKTSQ